jgi:mono/diheme cytochrome c family protein
MRWSCFGDETGAVGSTMRKAFLSPVLGIGGMLLLLGLWSVARADPPRANDGQTPASPGHTLFLARCAKCHDENGGKPLPGGKSLIERLESKDDLEAALSGRLKGLSPDERKAMVAYVSGLVQKLRETR